MTTRAKILIVDDHQIVRDGMAHIIADQPDLMVCGEADSRQAALKALAACRPDVVLLDLTLRDSSGFELLADLQKANSKLPVLVVSMHDECAYAANALRGGALGYVVKTDGMRCVLEGLRAVLAGRKYLGDSTRERFADALAGTPRTDSPMEGCSPRELEVFELIGQGNETREIAHKLRVSIKTVEVYRARLKKRLGARNSTELVQKVVQWRASR